MPCKIFSIAGAKQGGKCFDAMGQDKDVSNSARMSGGGSLASEDGIYIYIYILTVWVLVSLFLLILIGDC